MNRARDSSETSTARSVRGLDQPSSGGASEAPPRLCMDQSVPCTPSREVCSAERGVPLRCNAGAEELLQVDRNTAQEAGCVPHTCLLHSEHACVRKGTPRSVTTWK